MEPYQADIEGLIWLVVIVVSIISQIVKGTKKVSSRKPRPRATPSKDAVLTKQRRPVSGSSRQRPASSQRPVKRDPSAELRQFFETLGMPTESLAPAQKPAKKPQRQFKVQPKQQQQAPSASPTPPAAQAVEPLAIEASAASETVRLEHLKRKMSKRNRELRNLLKNQGSQRQAIALREILGPPVALR
jgi:hypothetical protein